MLLLRFCFVHFQFQKEFALLVAKRLPSNRDSLHPQETSATMNRRDFLTQSAVGTAALGISSRNILLRIRAGQTHGQKIASLGNVTRKTQH